jgi:hypothetical protein
VKEDLACAERAQKEKDMHRETSKVFLACAIGAATGSFVALGMSHAFWWVGLLVGGIVGYLSYEWKTVLRAIPAAYRAAREGRPSIVWIPRVFLCWLNVSIWMTVPTFLDPSGKMEPYSVIEHVFIGFAIGTVGWLVLILGGLVLAFGELSAQLRSFTDWLRMMNNVINPLKVIFYYVPKGIGIATYHIIRFCQRFGWQLFLRIHSEIRLLCGMDAMVGAAIGYFAGSAIIGALAGGLLGVVNYAVVSERWLKPRGYLPLRA